jgi:NTP pyrophosphatase (non-canonical NTP hydrolase)
MDNRVKETLLILQEECAEVTQAVSKCFRFGLDNFKPGKPATNAEHLETEIGDLLAMIDILVELGVVKQENLITATAAKKLKLKQWSNIYENA